MRRLILALLRQAFAWPCWPLRRDLPCPATPRDGDMAWPGAAACRRAWGEIRARYRLKGLLVPA